MILVRLVERMTQSLLPLGASDLTSCEAPPTTLEFIVVHIAWTAVATRLAVEA